MSKRHEGRELALTTLYSLDFNGEIKKGIVPDTFPTINESEEEQIDQETAYFARYLISGTLENLELIDAKISEFSINRPIERIDIIDRNILRLSVFTLLFDKKIHSHVVITEAVKLSQEYSREVNYKFINGILDSMEKHLL